MTEQQREAILSAIKEIDAIAAHNAGYFPVDAPGQPEIHELCGKVEGALAALSHAEGGAAPVAEITIDRHGDAHFKACPNYLDLDQGTYQLYTHPAPLVAGLTETAIKSSPAYRALHREKDHLLGLLKDQAPQVAVPEALTKYDGYVPPEDGSAGEYYVDGWNSCRDALLANSAPAQTVSASVPEQKIWNQAGGREDLRYTEGWNDCRAAMLAAAPTAPAGELVTRCTAGLGCDEKGHCDAAATGQGDMCDRRTMAHEQPVSDPDGLGAERARRLETATVAKLLLNAWAESEPDHPVTKHPASYAETFTDMAKAMMPLMAAPDEREIAARAIERAVGDYFKAEDGPHNLHDYLLWRVNRLRAGKEGE